MNDGGRAGLLIVDVQNDFCSGAALPVPDGDRVVNALNRYIDDAVAYGATVYASRDWHPAVTRLPWMSLWYIRAIPKTASFPAPIASLYE